MKKEDIENFATNLVKEEIKNYSSGEFFLTENVSVSMRPLIRLLRKNYWGVHEEPIDPTTKKEKQWVPITRLVVDSTRKQSDVDLSNLNFFANGTDGIGISQIVRGFVRNWMQKNFFGEVIDDSILQMCIDGTTVWKTYTVKIDGKTHVRRKTLDLLNVFIDPTADNIQEAHYFTERSLMSPNEIKLMTGWVNTDNLTTKGTLSRSEMDLLQSAPTGQFVDVYETWGLVPKKYVTGNDEDTGLVQAQIVVSGIETGDVRLHLIKENKFKDKCGNVIKPYEEMRYMKVPGRWYGVGPAEMVMRLQEWLNLIVNLRIIKNTGASLGLFKLRRGAGVTQQMLSNLVSRGVITLNNPDDLENMNISEAGESSYRDEEVVKNWSFEITSTYDIARGAAGQASSSATATSIENQNAKTAFALVIDSVAHMLNRWMDRHFLPHVPTMIKEASYTTIYSDFDDIDDIRERVVSYLAMQWLEENKDSYVPSEEELAYAMQEAEQQLRKNKNLFMQVVDEIIVNNIDTVPQFNNEAIDTSVTISNLINMSAQMEDPAAKNDLIMQAMDLMGLQIPESLRKVTQMQEQPEEGQMQTDLRPQSMQSLTTAANTMIQ